MKRLLVHRGEFSDALLAYLRALKNTGVTLRQFTESESLELEDVPPNTFTSPPSPPPPLPPSPPPPPFIPTVKSKPHHLEHGFGQQDSIEIDEDDDAGTPPPLIPSSSCDFWDPFEPISPQHPEKRTEHMDEEQWAETRTEFEEEQTEEILEDVAPDPLPEKPEKQPAEMVVDDSSSAGVSWNTREASDPRRMVAWMGKKTLKGIVKDLDDYFLKASALRKEIAILVDIKSGDAFPPQNLNKSDYIVSIVVFF